MTEAQGAELLEKIGELVEHSAKIREQLDYLGTASAFMFLALACILFFVIVGAVRRG